MVVREATNPPASRRAWRRFGILAMAALVGVTSATSIALAQSGDFPLTGNPGEVPTYSIPPASCERIREAIGNRPIDLVVACSIEGRASGARQTPCDLLDGSINVGVPLGQCQDSFPVPLTPVTDDRATLEQAVDLAGSAGGLNLALGDRDRISVTAGGAVLGLVNVQAGGCLQGECPTTCGNLRVVRNEAACDEVTAQLRTAAAADPPPLSHALFLDVQETGGSGFVTVGVCPRYKWTCTDPGTPALGGTAYQGQLAFSIAYTPICFRTSRLTYCCGTDRTGRVLRPCPQP